MGRELLHMTYEQTLMEHETIGFEKGVEQVKVGVITNMLKRNIHLEDIACMCGLTVDEVTELIKKKSISV